MHKKNIYVIWDKTAEDIAGSGAYLHLYGHDAPAIRMFQDVATLQQSTISAHVEEFDLVCLGTLGDADDHEQLPTLTADIRVVLTGTALKQVLQESK